MKVKIIETKNKYESNLEKNHAQEIEMYLYTINKELKDVQISTSFTKWNFDCEYNYMQSIIISE